jgi:hypothetical protein
MQMLILLTIGLAGLAAAQKTICDATCQKGCDVACQAAIQGIYEAESRLWVSDIVGDSFYSTPANITVAKPGDILRWEAVPSRQLTANRTIPASLSLYRYMYATEDIDEKVIRAGFCCLTAIRYLRLTSWVSFAPLSGPMERPAGLVSAQQPTIRASTTTGKRLPSLPSLAMPSLRLIIPVKDLRSLKDSCTRRASSA